ncbi:MAG: KpsF/GutQ family sugar-phosphate isomerase [Candidatus Omnitrophica bacterium]|nr:KpsF/GutQ family sugar-phosphate isomerase [Candidatus Omnitrophota bacterium]MBU1925860.1 KpsF/GutQ family sugar-phosphate isomerase [Candidatus Omnitrophota bacterium]
MNEKKIQKIAKQVLKTESKAITGLIRRINKDFYRAVELISDCKGRIVVTGMGKPGIIGAKISATLASLGVPSLFLHPGEAVHGDLGRVTKDDIVIAISNSGQTEEITRLLPLIKKIGARLIGFTGNTKSLLAKNSTIVLNVGVQKEACPFNLAPTASTTATLAMGDALAVAVLTKKGFKIEDYAFYHPGGSLGKKLLKVKDLMRKGADNPIVNEQTKVKTVLLRITRSRAGCAVVVNKKRQLKGIFTDGDLRRHIESDSRLLLRTVAEVMTADPVSINKERLAAEALKIIKEKKIDELPVVDDFKRPVGLLDIQDLLKAGIV